MAEMIDLQENMSGYMTGAIKGFCRQSWCQMVTRRAYFVRHHLRVIKPIILGSVILGIVGAAFGGFKIGEFANFQDPTFRKFHGIDASKVSRVFDKERQVFVSKYITRKDTNINSFSSVLINCVTESNNKISDISTTQIIQPKTSDGIEAAVNFVLGILEKMSFQSEQNRIIASSSNFSYRGHSAKETFDAMATAVLNIAKKNSGVLSVQWKTPSSYSEVQFTSKKVKGELLLFLTLNFSDQYMSLNSFD